MSLKLEHEPDGFQDRNARTQKDHNWTTIENWSGNIDQTVSQLVAGKSGSEINLISNNYIDGKTLSGFDKVGGRTDDSLAVTALFEHYWLRFISYDLQTDSDARGIAYNLNQFEYRTLQTNEVELFFTCHFNQSATINVKIAAYDSNGKILHWITFNSLHAIVKSGSYYDRSFKYHSVAYLPLDNNVDHAILRITFAGGEIADGYFTDFTLRPYQKTDVGKNNNAIINGEPEILSTDPWDVIDLRKQDHLSVQELFNKNWFYFTSGDVASKYVGIYEKLDKLTSYKFMNNMVELSFNINVNKHSIIQPKISIYDGNDKWISDINFEEMELLYDADRGHQYRYKSSTFLPYIKDVGTMNVIIRAKGNELQDFYINNIKLTVNARQSEPRADFLVNGDFKRYAPDPWDRIGYREDCTLNVEKLHNQNWLHFISTSTDVSDQRGIFQNLSHYNSQKLMNNSVRVKFSLHPNYSGIVYPVIETHEYGGVVTTHALKPIGFKKYERIKYEGTVTIPYLSEMSYCTLLIAGETQKALDFYVTDLSLGVDKTKVTGKYVEPEYNNIMIQSGDSVMSPQGTKLYKVGTVIDMGESGQFDDYIAESMGKIWWDENRLKFGTTYTGYHKNADGKPSTGAVGLAWSDDLLHWTKDSNNPIFQASGVAGSPDEGGVTGPVIHYENGIYYLYYIGLTTSDYEGGTKSLCLATSTDLKNWTRNSENPIIAPRGTNNGAFWDSKAIWHFNVIKVNNIYYGFFNATSPDNAERIGYATSSDLFHWKVDEKNSPILQGSYNHEDWDEGNNIDPFVYKIGKIFYMAYGGRKNSNVTLDGLAWTDEEHFPLGWKKWAGNPVINIDTWIGEGAAHKPNIFRTPDRYYHFYTSILNYGKDNQKWNICLATDKPDYQYAQLDCADQPRTINNADFSTVDQSIKRIGLDDKFNPFIRIIIIAKATDTLNIKDSIAGAEIDVTDTSLKSYSSSWYPVNNKDGVTEFSLIAKGKGEIDSIQYEIRWSGV